MPIVSMCLDASDCPHERTDVYTYVYHRNIKNVCQILLHVNRLTSKIYMIANSGTVLILLSLVLKWCFQTQVFNASTITFAVSMSTTIHLSLFFQLFPFLKCVFGYE